MTALYMGDIYVHILVSRGEVSYRREENRNRLERSSTSSIAREKDPARGSKAAHGIQIVSRDVHLEGV